MRGLFSGKKISVVWWEFKDFDTRLRSGSIVRLLEILRSCGCCCDLSLVRVRRGVLLIDFLLLLEIEAATPAASAVEADAAAAAAVATSGNFFR